MNFKVGDRIRIYGTDRNFNPIHGETTITGLTDNGSFYIEENESVVKKGVYDLTLPHPKQCRKLRKVKPPRRLWIPKDQKVMPASGYLAEMNVDALNDYLELAPDKSLRKHFVQFVEVRRGKK